MFQQQSTNDISQNQLSIDELDKENKRINRFNKNTKNYFDFNSPQRKISAKNKTQQKSQNFYRNRSVNNKRQKTIDKIQRSFSRCWQKCLKQNNSKSIKLSNQKFLKSSYNTSQINHDGTLAKSKHSSDNMSIKSINNKKNNSFRRISCQIEQLKPRKSDLTNIKLVKSQILDRELIMEYKLKLVKQMNDIFDKNKFGYVERCKQQLKKVNEQILSDKDVVRLQDTFKMSQEKIFVIQRFFRKKINQKIMKKILEQIQYQKTFLKNKNSSISL